MYTAWGWGWGIVLDTWGTTRTTPHTTYHAVHISTVCCQTLVWTFSFWLHGGSNFNPPSLERDSSHVVMDDRRAISGTYTIRTPIQECELMLILLSEFTHQLLWHHTWWTPHDVIMNILYRNAPSLFPRNCNNSEQLPVTYRRGRHTNRQQSFLQSTKCEITAL